MVTRLLQRVRRFVSLPFLLTGAMMMKQGADGMAVWTEGTTAYQVNDLRAHLGELWWQIGVALLGHEPQNDKLVW